MKQTDLNCILITTNLKLECCHKVNRNHFKESTTPKT